MFLIDGSINAGEDNFNKQLTFVRKLCNRFPITKNGVHVGLGVISDDGLVAFNLKENTDNSSVNAAIDKLTYPGGASNLGKAIAKTRGWILKPSGRKNVPKILVVLFKGTTSDDIKTPSAQIQEDGVKIISIGVEADRIQANTISSIVMFENLVEFLYDTEEKLNNVVNIINEASGVHTGVITEDLDEINGGRINLNNNLHGDSRQKAATIGGLTNNEDTTSVLEPVDIVFLIDGSENVGKDEFENELKFLQHFVKKFPISEATTRIALGTITDDGRVDFDFSNKQNARTIQKRLRLVTYPAGRMYAGKALKRVHDEIFKTYTRSVAQVLVMIMKERSLDDVKYIAADMREEGIKIIAIGLNKIHKDTDAVSSISIFKDGARGLISDTKIAKYLYETIKKQANNRV
ncbi:cochlin-like isoform X2 [Dendronephthya gigantea]|nr:cochlin-like isoform X2 [Dendronephthya gigantea]